VGTLPSPVELQRSVDFLKAQTATLKARPAPVPTPAPAAAGAPKAPSPELAALATLCQALLNSNAFLYAD
jgi:hypothetical protein